MLRFPGFVRRHRRPSPAGPPPRGGARRDAVRRIAVRLLGLFVCATAGAATGATDALAGATATTDSAAVAPVRAPVRAPERSRGPRLPRPQGGPDAKIFLTWHAPFGQPRASERLKAACGDTAAKDTLYLCFDPGRDTEHLLGLTATVYFWAASGDTLAPHWRFGEGMSFRGLEVEFNPDGVPGASPASPSAAVARAFYSVSAGSGKLQMIMASSEAQAQPSRAGTLYVLARVLVPRPAVKGARCDRPVCIEWAVASVAYGIGDEPDINRGQRFVSWNSPDDRACAPLREFRAPQPWRPPKGPRGR